MADLPSDDELRLLMEAVASGRVSQRLAVEAIHMMMEYGKGFEWVMSLRGSMKEASNG